MEKEEVTFAGAQESEDDSPPFVFVRGSWAENGFCFLKWLKKKNRKKPKQTHPKQKTLVACESHVKFTFQHPWRCSAGSRLCCLWPLPQDHSRGGGFQWRVSQSWKYSLWAPGRQSWWPLILLRVEGGTRTLGSSFQMGFLPGTWAVTEAGSVLFLQRPWRASLEAPDARGWRVHGRDL